MRKSVFTEFSSYVLQMELDPNCGVTSGECYQFSSVYCISHEASEVQLLHNHSTTNYSVQTMYIYCCSSNSKTSKWERHRWMKQASEIPKHLSQKMIIIVNSFELFDLALNQTSSTWGKGQNLNNAKQIGNAVKLSSQRKWFLMLIGCVKAEYAGWIFRIFRACLIW